GGDAPRVLVEAVPKQRLARGALRAEVPHVARIVLDLVGARTPGRQRQVQCVAPAGGKLGLHVEQLGGGRRNGHFVVDGLRGQRVGDEQGDEQTHWVSSASGVRYQYSVQKKADQRVSQGCWRSAYAHVRASPSR